MNYSPRISDNSIDICRKNLIPNARFSECTTTVSELVLFFIDEEYWEYSESSFFSKFQFYFHNIQKTVKSSKYFLSHISKVLCH
uniref:Uncharacterized protein n=1 Tax=Heterorhabditis bacteriophora TaxID=37862 RepID=A0A1I7WLL4_HETBA